MNDQIVEPAPASERSEPKRGHWFPVEALADALGVELGVIGGHRAGESGGGLAQLADLLGVSYSTMQRRLRAGFTEAQADEAAIRCGLQPELVWPAFARLVEVACWPPAARVNAAKTACPRGHAYDQVTREGWRRCSRCRRDRPVSQPAARSRRPSQPANCPEGNHLMSDKLLTTREVARRWQVSRRTVERLVAAGKLRATKIAGVTRYRLEDVEATEIARDATA